MRKYSFIKKKSILLFILLFFNCLPNSYIQAQDATYSQFFNNPVYYNPALAGQYLGMRMRLHHRNQWNGLPNNYNNFSFVMDVAERSYPGAGGIGLIVHSDFDGIGNVRTNSAALTNAVRIPISDDIITQFGVSLSYVQKSIDYDNFIFSDQLDPRFPYEVGPSNFSPPDFNNISYPDINFGLSLQFFESSRNINNIIGTISAAMHHAFKPDVSFSGNGSKLPHKFVFMGDLLLDNETARNRFRSPQNEFFFKLNPGFMYEMQGDLSSFILGANAYKNNVYAGMWLRSQDFIYTQVNDLIMLVGLFVPVGDSSRLKFMYSYDFVISDARRAVGSTHELSLIFELDGFSIFGESSIPMRNRPGCPECPPF